MHLLCTNLLLLASVVIAHAQPDCDTTTLYEENGQCCSLCPKGTRMTTLGSCQEPDCRECAENHYKDTYTRDVECDRQPYCDPNKNFQRVAVHKSKKEKTVCQCKEGFHCSGQDCIVCVEHQTCEPGQWAARKGDHFVNTKCEKCPDGTFSSETSWKSECKKWTECESGYHIQQAGTDKSDNICGSSHTNAIIVGVIVPLIIVALLISWYCFKGKSGNLQNCIESCRGEQTKQQKVEAGMLLPQPAVHVEEESTFHDALPSQEETKVTPEENDDESGLEISSDIALTDNGNFVTQEDGKKEILSRQESQTQTFSDYKCQC